MMTVGKTTRIKVTSLLLALIMAISMIALPAQVVADPIVEETTYVYALQGEEAIISGYKGTPDYEGDIDGLFLFALVGPDGYIVDVTTNDGDGNFSFSVSTETVGEFDFTVVELGLAADFPADPTVLIGEPIADYPTPELSDGWTLDDTIWPVTVVVESIGSDLWVWGVNSNYELGTGANTSINSPTLHPLLSVPIRKVIGGGNHALALDFDGNIWAWGYNAGGQVGNGLTTTRQTPVQLVVPGTTFVDIAAGFNHSLAIDSNGDLWGWGTNTNGQVGIGSTTSPQTIPVPLGNKGVAFDSVFAGNGHSIALDSNGEVWTWGTRALGVIGDGGATTGNQTTPLKLTSISNITAISTRGWHNLALGSNGHVWAWGNRANFALGDDGSTFGAQTSPIDISAPSTAPLNGVTITKISAGSYHSLALDEDGHVWVWGTRSATSPLGDGLTTPAAQGAPKDISIITGSPDHFENATIVEIAASASHSLALDDAGNVWAWGSNGSGQLGLGASVPTSSAWPLNITDLASSLDGIVIDSIAVGNNSSFALSGLNEEGGQSGEIIFINTYEEPVVAVTIDIEKQVSEGAPSVEFEFTLVQTDGEEITPINSTVQITGNGTGSFDLGDLSAGVYTFTITETSGGGYGWSNDEVVRTVTVTVSGNPLDYSVEFDTLNGDIFINSYEEPVVAVFIDIEKQVSEGAPSVEFEFTLVQTDGPEITPFNSTVQITGTGTGSFDLGDLSAGVYTFTITETSGGGIGWTNDEVVRTVTVTVSGNPLDYSVEFDTLDGNIFVNTYEEPVEPPADAVLSLRKVVLDADENSVAVPGTFKVWLYDAKKDPIASFDLVAGAVAIDVAELTLGETYYVMEAKRTGFNLLGYVVAFGGDETWYTTEAIKIDVPEQVSNPVFAVTVVNKVDAKAGPNPVPPKTGDVMSFWPVAVLLVGLAIVVVVASRKRFER